MASSNDFRSGTKRRFIAECVERQMSADSTYHAIRPLVQSQSLPWVFAANTPSGRTPKPMAVQLTELRHEINRVFAIFGRDGISDEVVIEDMEEPNPDDEIEAEIERAKKRSEKLGAADGDVESQMRFFLSEIRRIRSWVAERAKNGDTVDEISMRPVVMAKTGIPAGIPPRALLAMMAMHWSPETRAAANIADFDFVSFSLAEMEKRSLDTDSYHRLCGITLLLAEARIPIMAIGPSGTGKSHLAKNVAEILSLDYAECPMTAGATPSWLLGSHTVAGFNSRPFIEIYSKGGVFNFEEIDAADPNMLLVANNALAGSELFNPMNGETYTKSENFIGFATANTFGLGANRMHTARERMDAATIDRWRMGRVFVPIDADLEEAILLG